MAAGCGQEGVDRGVVVTGTAQVRCRTAGQGQAMSEVVVDAVEVVREGDHGDHLLGVAVSLQSRSRVPGRKPYWRAARAIGTCMTPSSSNSGPVTSKP